MSSSGVFDVVGCCTNVSGVGIARSGRDWVSLVDSFCGWGDVGWDTWVFSSIFTGISFSGVIGVGVGVSIFGFQLSTSCIWFSLASESEVSFVSVGGCFFSGMSTSSLLRSSS